MIALNIEKILDTLEIDYVKYPNRIAFPCPIHESSRKESLTVFTEGNTSIGNYVCWTNHCEQDVGKGVFNLVKKIIESKRSCDISFKEAVNEIVKITGITCPKEVLANKEIRQFTNLALKSTSIPELKVLASRDYVKKNLTVTAQHFIDRGFKSETLNHFDVGMCVKRGQEMFMRIVVPVYDITGKNLVGCVGRSVNPECFICGQYHAKNKKCPSNALEEMWSRKWINSSGFNTGHCLYNIWNAAPEAIKTQKLILVEGQGDVWKLYEAGIKNAVGLFGNKLTDTQFMIIESLGITDIFLALDSDEEGIKGKKRIIDKLSMYYNVHDIKLSAKDVGEMSIDQIKMAFKDAYDMEAK